MKIGFIKNKSSGEYSFFCDISSNAGFTLAIGFLFLMVGLFFGLLG